MRQCLRQKHYTSKGVKEHKLIRCDKFGYFKTLQKQDGKMICVDFQGNIKKSFGVTGRKDCLGKHDKGPWFSLCTHSGVTAAEKNFVKYRKIKMIYFLTFRLCHSPLRISSS